MDYAPLTVRVEAFMSCCGAKIEESRFLCGNINGSIGRFARTDSVRLVFTLVSDQY